MSEEAKRAIVLLSGGLDSSTCLAVARQRGFECYALSFRYGQRHVCELDAAARVAKAFDVREHLTIDVDMRAIGGSALTADIDVPKGRSSEAIGSGIPVTYVPARNTVFLSFALAWAEALDLRDIFIGVNVLDYSGYPDCRPEFIEAFEALAACATAFGVAGERLSVHAPLMKLDKAAIIRLGLELGVDYALTHSCYDPRDAAGRPCGACDACILRLDGFAAAGATDPLDYPAADR
ncbi:MAG: 7-cyano-7-deazaguanine synthase QueC [Myxococcales bacterium]|nr:7-cyano-7-deazaguanine synthase QueC [Myxococcales bacterium]